MIRNYLKIAWRHIRRNSVNSFINIVGLAIGMASVILIIFFVHDELSYDRFLKNADHIFQVNLDGKMGGEEGINGNTPPPAGAALVNAFPEIESYTRIYRPSDVLVRYEEGQQSSFFTEKNIWAMDSNFFQMFSFRMKEGSPAHCLDETNSVVITEKIAEKYFGNANPMGKVLLFGDQRKPCKVTGVLYNLPAESSLQFDMAMPTSFYKAVERFNWSWVWMQVSTYVKLRDNVSVDPESIRRLEAKFPAMVSKQAADAFKAIGKPLDELIKEGGRWDLKLQPLTSVHLYSARVGSRLQTLGNIQYVYIFSIIAVFIILLACVNFMNLSTARSAQRAKEVGIRKVLGSVKSRLIKQFLTEAMVYSFLATILALILVALMIGPFNSISGKSLYFGLIFSNHLWLWVIGLFLITGLLAGSYPAFYLTSFQPVAVLKGWRLATSRLGNLFIRNGLVVFQFTISTALIVCTIVVFRQLGYTQHKDLGLDKENVIVIANSNRLGDQEMSFRNEVVGMPGVVNASICTSVPSKENFGDGYVPEPEGHAEEVVKDLTLSSFIVDENYVPVLDIHIIKGRNFSKEFNDSTSVILNETAVRAIGWKNPVGRYLEYPGNGNQRFKVIGVAKDFNTQSLRSLVTPFALFYTSSKTYDLGSSMTMVRIKPGAMNDRLRGLEDQWKKMAPNTPFDYSFLDSEFEALYRAEQRMGTVFGIFTGLSIFVACLGLFGLAAYTAERRTKEIGVRKVLGASVTGITAMLSKDFLKLVVLSVIIAFPIAWYGMSKWLEDFAYRISIDAGIFLLAGFGALLIALLTVSFQAIRAAIANPVKSLRTE